MIFMRPTVLKYARRSLPIWLHLRAERGSRDLHKWCLRAFITVGRRLLGCPFLFVGREGNYSPQFFLMKVLFGAGVFLALAGSVMMDTGAVAAWMVHSGVILVVAGFAVFTSRKRSNSTHPTLWKTLEVVSFGLVLFFLVWEALMGIWYVHPLGGLIQVAGGGWAFYQGWKVGKKSPTTV
jgi:hypothetical protein